MAVLDRQTIDLPMPGMALDSLSPGQVASGYVQNLRWDSTRWGTRPGFGLLSVYPDTPWHTDATPTVKAVSTLRTDSGKSYVVTLATQTINTSLLGNTTTGQTKPSENQLVPLWVLAVYDLKAQTWMHTILTRRASDVPTPLYDVEPNRGAGGWEVNGALNTGYEYSKGGYNPLIANNPDAPWSFAQAQDRLLMVHPDIGLWQVSPGLTGSDRVGIDSISGRDCQSGFGESAWASPVRVRNGLEDQDYLTADEVGVPSIVTQYQGRTVLVPTNGRALYFSDAGDPAAYSEANIVTFLTETPIRAVLSVRNALLVLTRNEAILYVPSDGANPSAGLTTFLSNTTGITSAGMQAATFVDETAVWVSDRGVHTYGGGTAINNIAAPLANLWIKDDPIPNPLTAFDTNNNGSQNTTTDQTNPVQVLDLSSIYLSYEDRKRELYLCIPSLSRAIVFAFDTANNVPQIGWWVFATQVHGGNSIQTTVTLDGLRILANPDLDAPQFTLGVTSNGALYALGRGGSMDQSSHPSEDHSNPMALRWRQETAIANPTTNNVAAFYVGPAYRLPTGFVTANQTTTQDVWEFRIWIQVPDLRRLAGPPYIDRIQLDLRLVAANWRLLTVNPGVSADLDYTVGATFGDLQSGFVQMQATNFGGLPDPNGTQVTIDWQVPGAPPASGWFSYPNPALPPHQMIELCRVRMVRSQPSSVDTSPVNNFVDQIPFARFTSSTTTIYRAVAYHGYVMDRRGNQAFGHDARQRPVDWAYHTLLIGDMNTTMKIRGLWVKCRRSGNASATGGAIFPNWPTGTTGWMYATNDRELSYMEADPTAGGPEGLDRGNDPFGGIPTMTDGTADPTYQVWGQASAPPPLLSPKWGNHFGAQQGNVIVGTTPVSQWVCTSGGRGETVRYLLFGYIRGRAEYIRFADSNTNPLSLIVRPQANRKRRGGQ